MSQKCAQSGARQRAGSEAKSSQHDTRSSPKLHILKFNMTQQFIVYCCTSSKSIQNWNSHNNVQFRANMIWNICTLPWLEDQLALCFSTTIKGLAAFSVVKMNDADLLELEKHRKSAKLPCRHNWMILSSLKTDSVQLILTSSEQKKKTVRSYRDTAFIWERRK